MRQLLLFICALHCTIEGFAQINFLTPVTSPIEKPIIGTGSDYNFKNADFNGDGILDMVVKRGESTFIDFYLGKGAGDFVYDRSLSLSGSKAPRNLVCADFNNDSRADIAYFTNWTGNSASPDSLIILLGDGNINFIKKRISIKSYDIGWVATMNMIAKDLNNDKKIDLIIGSSLENRISSFIGDGSGNFSMPTITNNPFAGEVLVVSDINKDGYKDIVVTPDLINKNRFSILIGDSTGSYKVDSTYSFATNVGHITNSDIDKDGVDELIVTYYKSTPDYINVCSVLKNTGAGKFKLSTEIISPIEDLIVRWESTICEDFDLDGNIDLAFGSYLSERSPSNPKSPLKIYRGNGSGGFYTTASIINVSTHSLASFDVNNDGKMDLIGIDSENRNIIAIVNFPKTIQCFPNSGGNGGTVTVNFYGNQIRKGMKVKLVGTDLSEITVPDSMIWFPADFQMKVALNLRNRQIGKYDVVISSDNEIFTLVKGFTVEEFVAADIWATVIGPNLVRSGTPTTFNITYGNRGNTDALVVQVWLVVSSNAKIEFIEKLQHAYGTVDTTFYAPIDTLLGKPFKGKLFYLAIPLIEAKSIGSIPIKVTSSGGDIDHYIWINPPLFSSPMKPSAQECLVELKKLGLEALIGAGLNFDLSGIMSCTWEVNMKDAFEKSYYTTAYGNPASGYRLPSKPYDVGMDATQTAIACLDAATTSGILFPPILLAKIPLKVGSILFDLMELWDKTQRLMDECRETMVPNPKKGERGSSRTVNSCDPNDKIGVGINALHYITGKEPAQYAIRFENQATASASAQIVRLLDTLDRTKYDLSTFQLNYFHFGDRYIYIPPGQRSRVEEIDLRPKLNLILRIQATLNETTGILETIFTSLDPVTRMLTNDPVLGFLPPNKKAPEGEGSIFYTVNVKKNLPNKTAIYNRAFIYFDNNQVIPTPIWTNTIDVKAPDSKVDALPDVTTETTFTVKWKGNDGESGIRNYNVYYSINGRPYQELIFNTTATDIMFKGQVDSTYQFYSVAVDSVSNIEQIPALFDSRTTIRKILSVERTLSEQMVLYPNPSDGDLIMELPSGVRVKNLSVIDMAGRIVEVDYNQLNNNKYKLLLGYHKINAIYLIQIDTNQGKGTKKILLRH
ncbi:T9SS type A sorting domain-containing protein [Larkinella rosea]|nr:T9SS type A sorting domain-containing protein [Larkinella rosea]